MYSARSGGYNALDKEQAYGNNYNPEFIRTLEASFRAGGLSGRSLATVGDGLSTARDNENIAGIVDWVNDD